MAALIIGNNWMRETSHTQVEAAARRLWDDLGERETVRPDLVKTISCSWADGVGKTDVIVVYVRRLGVRTRIPTTWEGYPVVVRRMAKPET